jgi:photosystem II stability/assembly factor-like uncharacterized protein
MNNKIYQYSIAIVFLLFCFSTGYSQKLWERTGTFDGENSGIVLSIGVATNGHLFACVNTGAPVYRSVNNGLSWEKSSLPSNNYINAFARKDTMIFAASFNGVFRSLNNGATWKLSNTGLTTTNIKTVIVAPNGLLYAGTRDKGVFRSDDNGNTWTPVNEGLSNLKINVIAAVDSNVLFAATDGEGLFVSMDSGESWKSGSSEVRLNYVHAISVSSQGHVYVGTDNYGVFRTKNLGSSWEGVLTEISGKVNTIAISYQNPIQNTIYVGTSEHGIYYTTNDGNSWNDDNVGLDSATSIAVYSFAITPDGSIFAGTSGGAVYKKAVVVGVDDEQYSSVSQFDYIIPSQDGLHISFTLNRTSSAHCTLYSILGERIAVLFNTSFNSGRNDIFVPHTSDFPLSTIHGIYYCHVSTPYFSFTRPVYIP